MPIPITDNQPTAARRRIPLLIFADTSGAAWAASVTGVKPTLNVNGVALGTATNDVVRVGGIEHYIELTQAEANRTSGDLITARLDAATGRLASFGMAYITAGDVAADSPTDASIATAVDTTITPRFTTLGTAVAARFGGSVVGGTSSVVPVYDAGNSNVLLGTVVIYRDVTGAVVGQSALTPP